MRRVLSGRINWSLHDAATARRVERQALAGLEPNALMQRAGAAVAALARAQCPHAQHAWVLCGPGNNGGDGLVAALHLQAAGLHVEVTLAADPAQLPADARQALARAQTAGVTVSTGRASSKAPDLAIDALLGLGGNRAPAENLARWITELNALTCPVLAVDLPSGLNADTGQAHGDACVKATHTLALLTLKPGLFTSAGRDHAGDVWFDDLGVGTTEEATALLCAAPEAPDRRQHAQHKGSFGDVAVVGGAPGMVGAAWLAARAAHAAGAGRVYVSLLDPAAPLIDPQRPELMIRAAWWHEAVDTISNATVVCGCGGGDAVRAALPRLLSLAARLVLDADALNAVAVDSTLQQLLAARRARGRDTVLTPHPLEAARLLNISTAVVQADRLAAAQQLAERFSSVVVLKGSGTVIAEPAVTPRINASGNAALATAGTGDVLAGWLAGRWSAAGPEQPHAAQEAARQAVWLHGHAADLCTTTPLRAADLIEAMHAASLR